MTPLVARKWLHDPVVLVVALSTAAALGYAIPAFDLGFKAVAAASVLGACAVLTYARPGWLPAAAILVWLAIPYSYLALPPALSYVSPAGALLLVWLLRRAAFGPKGSALAAADTSTQLVLTAVCLLGTWTVLAGVLGVSFASSRVWLANLVVLVVLFSVGAAKWPADVVYARRAFITGCGVLGALALVETYVLRDNPLFGDLFAGATSGGFTQYTVWDTYRASTTLGHPLLNSAVFATGFALAFAAALEAKSSSWSWLIAALAAGGALASASRGGLASLAIAASVVLALSLMQRERRGRTLAVTYGLVVFLGLFGATLAAGALERQGSAEGRTSANARVEFAQAGLQMSKQSLVHGFGPGGALVVAAESTGNGRSGNFENSYIEYLLAAGVVGLLLLLCTYCSVIGRGLIARDVGLVGAMLAYGVTQAGFNLLQAYPAALIIMGLLAAFSCASERPTVSAVPASVAKPRRVV